eukprot:8842864-Pyramimonas_sp.AAC.1
MNVRRDHVRTWPRRPPGRTAGWRNERTALGGQMHARKQPPSHRAPPIGENLGEPAPMTRGHDQTDRSRAHQ